MTPSRFFGQQSAKAPHLVRSGGLAGEIGDLRHDVESAFALQESESSGATAHRPATPFVGQRYFDTTLTKEVVWTGSAWLVGGLGTVTGSTTASNSSASTGIAGTGAANDDAFIHEFFRVPVATGTALLAAAAKAASPKSLTTQTDVPRTLLIELSGGWVSTADVTLSIDGYDKNGLHISEEIIIPADSAGGATVETLNCFATVDAGAVVYDAPAGWTAGTFDVQAGTRLGLLGEGTYHPFKEAVSTEGSPTKVNVASGTVSALGGYLPTSAIDGTNNIDVWYRATDSHLHGISDPGHNHTQSGHTHAL